MQAAQLTALLRDRAGSSHAGRTRRAGRIPAVLYGGGGEPRAISIEAAEMEKVLRQSHDRISLVTLSIGGATEPAVLKAIQRDAVNERIAHLDFLRVDLTKPITLDIPVAVEGTSPGVKLGGVLQQSARAVRVRCLPGAVPAGAVADISALEIGDALHARDLKLPPGVDLLTPAGDTILWVTVVRVEEEAAPAADAAAAGTAETAAAQPEVIGEKEREERKAKKDEEKGAKAKEKAEIKDAAAKEAKPRK
jgi:large subunit ribosomal protein L25